MSYHEHDQLPESTLVVLVQPDDRSCRLDTCCGDVAQFKGSENSMYYPAIDGLRAIAVVAVVLYHVGEFLPAGFIGVDISISFS